MEATLTIIKPINRSILLDKLIAITDMQATAAKRVDDNQCNYDRYDAMPWNSGLRLFTTKTEVLNNLTHWKQVAARLEHYYQHTLNKLKTA